MMAPILILIIYILFMGEFQINTIRAMLPSEVVVSNKEIAMIANSWMIAGIIGISSLTISLNSMFVAISDRERGIVDDFTASPVPLVNLTLSYFISAFIITFVLSFVFLVIALFYLFFSSGLTFSVLNLFELLGILLLSSLSAVIFVMCLTAFFKHTSTAASFTGVYSALIGFFDWCVFTELNLASRSSKFCKPLTRFACHRPLPCGLNESHFYALERNNSRSDLVRDKKIVMDSTSIFLAQSSTERVCMPYLGVSIIVMFILYQLLSLIKRKLKN